MISVHERPFGKSWDSTSARIGYLVVATSGETEDAIKTAIEAEAPGTYRNLPLSNIRADEINIDEDGEPSMWDVEAQYGGRIAIFPQTGDIIWSGTTAGGTQKISHGIKFREATAPGGGDYRVLGASFTAWRVADATLPANWGAIGATKEGVAGVDIVVPVDSFQAVKYVAAAEWPALRSVLKILTGRINNAPWTADTETYNKGEVLFLGALQWTQRPEMSDYEVVFGFAAGEHAEDLEIGEIPPEPPGITKDAWDYLDITYENKENGGFLVQRPIFATVHRVYKSGNFGALGLSG